MGKNLVIVESPAKARTIEKYLGQRLRGARVVRPRARSGAEGRRRRSGQRLRDEVPAHRQEREARRQDRQGREESFGACISRPTPIAKAKRSPGTSTRCSRNARCSTRKPVQRVVFHEVTKRAIQEAIDQPRELSEQLVNAQQARRALDYLVGFNLSPLLWKKVRRGLSAGRVQSPALRLIVEREDEITRVQGAGVLDDRSARASRRRRAFPARLAVYARREGRAVHVHRRGRGARGRADDPRHRARRADGREGRQEAAPPQSGGAVHDLDAPTGSVAQARLQRAAHDDAWRSACTKASTSAKAPSA